MNTAAVLTISDSSFHGTRKDLSGPAVVRELTAAGFQVTLTAILPDEREQIQQKLVEWSRQARLVVTVGGTGIAVRDVTPEATLAVVERLIEGIPEKMRATGAAKTPLAALSRGICGVRGESLILNLPGSPKAAVESLQAVAEILPHALDLLAGNTEHREHLTGNR
ncbi:MAG TPA: MogA/MoaB family molybdenum cofactor biosynthesis protein [Candidatus Angelobacter sp.]|nr:MogA/MoaB family molybdenum cofactor biosynthesis protein [Candidatus Angelobacter sp.]